MRCCATCSASSSRRVEACFDELTVADLCARAEQLGVAQDVGRRYVYVI